MYWITRAIRNMTLSHKGEKVDIMPAKTYVVSNNEVDIGIAVIGEKLRQENWIPDKILYIPRGGEVPAMLLRNYIEKTTGKRVYVNSVEAYRFYGKVKIKMPYHMQTHMRYLVMDDIHDTGKTYKAILDAVPDNIIIRYAFLFIRDLSKLSFYEKQDLYYGHECKDDSWLVFPWEIEREQS